MKPTPKRLRRTYKAQGVTKTRRGQVKMSEDEIDEEMAK